MQAPGKKVFGGEEFYTDWMPRGGDGFIIRGQVIDSNASSGDSMTVDVYTKNTEETGDGTTISSATLTLQEGTTAVAETLFEPTDGVGSSGVKELVRLKVSAANLAASEWMLVRTFPFLWFDGAKSSIS